MRGKVTNFATNKTVKEMKEGKRQKQVASVFQAELNDIFMKLGLNMFEGGMVSIADVKVTPDLLEARIYLSLFQVENPTLAMKHIEERAWEIKKLLGEKIKSQVRRMPVIHYYLDDTLEHVFKMEALFKQIEDEKKAREGNGQLSVVSCQLSKLLGR